MLFCGAVGAGVALPACRNEGDNQVDSEYDIAHLNHELSHVTAGARIARQALPAVQHFHLVFCRQRLECRLLQEDLPTHIRMT